MRRLLQGGRRVIPAPELAALDQAQAACEDALMKNVALYRQHAESVGSGEALMQLCIELGRECTPHQLGSMLAVAIARIARREA